MAIHRGVRPQHSFTILENSVLRDEKLSYRARGVLAYILSHTDDWSITSEELARRGAEGRDALRTALTELEAAGYVRREKRRDSSGRVSTQTVVYDTPQAEDADGLFPQVAPATGKPAPVDPAPGEPAPDNQAPIEDHPQKTSPSGEGVAPPAPGRVIATAVYDQTQGMVNFIAVQQIATKALRVKGSTPERVIQVMVKLYADGRPLTLATVGQALQRGDFRDTHQDHWAEGGQF